MDVLIIGGTGPISHAVAQEALAGGARVTVVNRGRSTSHAVPDGAEVVMADARDPASFRSALGGRAFDIVIDFVAFTPAHATEDIETFAGRTGQFIFISSASAYAKPVARLPITESTPLRNPYWQYSRDKIAAEDAFIRAYREDAFPVVIVRPSSTYDRTRVPIGGWTVVERMRAGKPVMVAGDGTSLWTVTHASDVARAFVHLLGRDDVFGEAFHITREDAMPWDAIYRVVGDAAGVEPELVHVPADLIARIDPESGSGYLGDKCHSVLFDNSKIKRIAPDWAPQISLAEGARQVIGWFDADPTRRRVDARLDALHEAAINFMTRPIAALRREDSP